MAEQLVQAVALLLASQVAHVESQLANVHLPDDATVIDVFVQERHEVALAGALQVEQEESQGRQSRVEFQAYPVLQRQMPL